MESQIEFIKDNGPLITAGYRRERDGIITTFIPRDEITFKKALKGNDMSCLINSLIGKVVVLENWETNN